MRYVVLLLASISLPLQADIVLSYDALYGRLKKLQKPEYSDISLAIALQQQGTGAPCQILDSYAQSDIHHLPISLASDGEIYLPYDESLKDSKATLVFVQADNARPCDLQFRIRSRMPLKAELSVEQLQHYQQQFNSLLRELAGMGRYWMTPVSGIGLQFAEPVQLLNMAPESLTAVTECENQSCIIQLEQLENSEALWHFNTAPQYAYPYIRR